jgi:hypothetical protein
MLSYRLTNDDIEIVRKSVKKRIEISAEAGLNHATTYQRDMETRIREETVGAGAELAWAHLNGREWHNPLNEFHHIPDDGLHEIRATDHPKGGLIIRDNDPDNRKYIFATANGRLYIFRGWVFGYEAKIPDRQWNPHGLRPAWRVDRSDLHPMKMLEDGNMERNNERQ